MYIIKKSSACTRLFQNLAVIRTYYVVFINLTLAVLPNRFPAIVAVPLLSTRSPAGRLQTKLNCVWFNSFTVQVVSWYTSTSRGRELPRAKDKSAPNAKVASSMLQEV